MWLIGEIIAYGTARAQMNGNLIFREANMRSPSLLAAVGSILLLAAPDQVGQIPVGTIGWVVTDGATVWLVVEAVANGVTRARGRRRPEESRQGSPIILN